MSASRVLFQVGLRRGLPSSVSKRPMPLSRRRPLTSTPSCPTTHAAAAASVSGLRHGLSQLGRARSTIPPLPRLEISSLRSLGGSASLSSSSEGLTGPRPMKVAIIGQSLFGREVRYKLVDRGCLDIQSYCDLCYVVGISPHLT